MKRITLLLIFLTVSSSGLKAQLNAADSSYFLGVFTSPKYIDDSVYSGNWYQYNAITSMYEHYLILDTNFKYKTPDLDSINYLTIDDSLHYDTMRNNAFNTYPALLNQTDPIVYVPYTFMNKHSRTYSIRYKDSNQHNCRYAFLLVPGTGINASYDIVKGIGYHNQLCLMKNNLINYGDVYTFIKPNEESRAVHWNGLKLNNEYVVSYLITQNTRYGINYLIEMIAMIKYLKANYDKVFLFGLSEGGYSALLCTMYIEPDAAMISGGYSIDFDTCTVEKEILKTRFDYLLDTFDRVKVKNRISSSNTNYLFTWGDGDPVLTMDPEHDFHYTQNYFSGLNNCSYFYNFNDHTFPPCADIDTFVQRIINIPLAHFFVTDSSLADTLLTRARFCTNGLYQFDLYKDTSLIQAYSLITDSVNISLTDSGKYYITHITDSNNIAGRCSDTVFCTKQAIASGIKAVDIGDNIKVQYNNPFSEQIHISILSNIPNSISVSIYNNMGIQVYKNLNIVKNKISIPAGYWPPGIYYMNINTGQNNLYRTIKLLKN